MLPKTARSANLLLAGMLAGNEFGTWAALAARGSARFRRTLLGVLIFAAMLASTRLVNVPIDDRTPELTDHDVEEFGRLRDRWSRLHALRVALTTVGFAVLASGALAGVG